MEEIYKEYRNRANFFVVYIREAHPVDGWRTKENDRKGIEIPQAKTFEERSGVANTCAAELDLTIPMLVDGIDNRVGEAYCGWPDRLFVVGTDRRIAFRGERGPRGFKPNDMVLALKEVLGNSGSKDDMESALDKALEGDK
ncbi:MAG: hypothetical protein HY720_12625 [Planctomycetes bacterium]|nr:hypothetical protein [Planctomycetota bacterium]